MFSPNLYEGRRSHFHRDIQLFKVGGTTYFLTDLRRSVELPFYQYGKIIDVVTKLPRDTYFLKRPRTPADSKAQ